MKFKLRSEIIEAEQYKSGMEDGFNCYKIEGFDGHIISRKFIGYFPGGKFMPRVLQSPVISTSKGNYEISKGDWIITGADGERHPIKSDVFEFLFEKVDD